MNRDLINKTRTIFKRSDPGSETANSLHYLSSHLGGKEKIPTKCLYLLRYRFL